MLQQSRVGTREAGLVTIISGQLWNIAYFDLIKSFIFDAIIQKDDLKKTSNVTNNCLFVMQNPNWFTGDI